MSVRNGRGQTDCGVCRRLRAGLLSALAERDLDSLSELEVAARAGVAPGAFESHYGSVHECVLATYDELSDDLYGRWARLLRADGDWNLRVERLLTHALDYFASTPGAARLFFVEACRVGDRSLQERRAADRQWLVRLLARGYTGEPDDAGTELRLEFLVGALSSTVQDGLAAGDGVELIAERVRQLLPLLEPAPA
jgi:AcrR family transcriptional regulator